MKFIGDLIIYMIMLFALIGAICSVCKKTSLLGDAFLRGAETLGTIFLPVAGIMAMAPVLTSIITNCMAPIYDMMGADAAMAATTFIAVDMGGYQLAASLAQCKETWIMAMITGYMAGATIVFTIPIALKIMKPKHHSFLALGTMAGFISIPIGVFVSSLFISFTHPMIREHVATSGPATYEIQLQIQQILHNLLPLIVICSLLAFGLFKKPALMMKGFQVFGNCLNKILKLVFVFCVIEHFTNACSTIMQIFHSSWFLDPIVADSENLNRALESTGYISMMLCGTFPMVCFIQTYGKKTMLSLSSKLHMSEFMMTAIIACCANVLALLSMIEQMEDDDKVKSIAFAVGCSFLLGDHLAFTVNFQPSLLLPIMLGKISAGVIAILIANYFVLPAFRRQAPSLPVK